MNITVRYRYNDRDVRTPIFDASEYVRFDAVPEEIEEGFTPQFDISRQFFDANASFTPVAGALSVGYGHEAVERHGRGFSDVGEHIFRVSFDTFSSQYVTVRAASTWGGAAAKASSRPASTTNKGRAARSRRWVLRRSGPRPDAWVALLTVMPSDTIDLYVQFASTAGTNTWPTTGPVDRPGELFGLQVRRHQLNVGANFTRRSRRTGGNYGHDVTARCSGRATPTRRPTRPGQIQAGTGRSTTTTGSTRQRCPSICARPAQTDIRFAYDYSDSDNGFVHGGPRIAALASVNQFIRCPTSRTRGTG